MRSIDDLPGIFQTNRHGANANGNSTARLFSATAKKVCLFAVVALGVAAWGSRGRKFESSRPDG